MTHYKKFTAEVETIICSRYLGGENTVQLGNAFGVNHGTIGKILKRNGVKTRGINEAMGGINPAVEPEVCRRYLAGENTIQLSNAFEVHFSTISKILKRNGVKIRSNSEAKGGLSAEVETIVCRRYLGGENSYQLSNAFGVTSATICQILKRSGVKARSSGESQSALDAAVEPEICSRYLAGENSHQLGNAFGVYNATICRILKRHNVEARSSGLQYGDSVQHILEKTGLHAQPRECSFYLYELAGHSETHCKPGIAFDVSRRANEGGGQYGLQVLEQVFPTRAEAWFLEQAVLDETRSNATQLEELENWSGATEVRSMAADDMEPIVIRLAEELEELGMWAFASAYVPMTAAQRAICQQRIDRLSYRQTVASRH